MRNMSAYLSMRSLRLSRGTSYTSPIKLRYWMPVRYSYRSGLSGMYAVSDLHNTGFSFTELPSMKISPSSKPRMPVTARRVVVLPAPFCPMNP